MEGTVETDQGVPGERRYVGVRQQLTRTLGRPIEPGAAVDDGGGVGQRMVPNLAAYLSEGATSAKAKLFVPSPGTNTLLERRAKAKVADTKETYIASVADTFEPSGEPLTFITSSGEALVFVTLTEQYLQRVEPGSNAYWTSGEATAFSSMVKYTQTLHQDYLYQAAWSSRPRPPAAPPASCPSTASW